MIDLNDGSNENERLALAIFKAMEDGEVMEKIEELCTEDFEWANSGLTTLKGKRHCAEHFASGGFATEIPILKTMTHFSADLVHIASNGNVVFTERVDHHWDAEGRDLMTPHIAGVIEIRDGKISALRDYYDIAVYKQKPTEPNPEFALKN